MLYFFAPLRFSGRLRGKGWMPDYRKDLFLNACSRSAERKGMSMSKGHPYPDQEYVTRQIGSETIIVPVRGGIGDLNSIYTLNESATSIWQMVSDGKSLPEIVEAICSLYDISADEAAQDAAGFIHDLKSAGILPNNTEIGG
jgi:hypothetical protein